MPTTTCRDCRWFERGDHNATGRCRIPLPPMIMRWPDDTVPPGYSCALGEPFFDGDVASQP
jgi:hypothetical protein